MSLSQITDHLWLAAYSQLPPQYLEKLLLDRLWACVAFAEHFGQHAHIGLFKGNGHNRPVDGP